MKIMSFLLKSNIFKLLFVNTLFYYLNIVCNEKIIGLTIYSFICSAKINAMGKNIPGSNYAITCSTIIYIQLEFC